MLTIDAGTEICSSPPLASRITSPVSSSTRRLLSSFMETGRISLIMWNPWALLLELRSIRASVFWTMERNRTSLRVWKHSLLWLLNSMHLDADSPSGELSSRSEMDALLISPSAKMLLGLPSMPRSARKTVLCLSSNLKFSLTDLTLLRNAKESQKKFLVLSSRPWLTIRYYWRAACWSLTWWLMAQSTQRRNKTTFWKRLWEPCVLSPELSPLPLPASL